MRDETLLKELTQLWGVAGFERSVREYIEKEVRPLADEMITDAIGNLIVMKKGRGGENAKKIMYAAHMDEIGFMVKKIESDGRLRVCNMGWNWAASAYNGRVRFRNGIYGVVGCIGPLEEAKNDIGKLFVDIGATSAEDAAKYVQLGDCCGYEGIYHEMRNDLVCAKSLDNRIGCYQLIEALKEKLSGLNEKLEKAGSERTARAEEQKKYFEKRDEIAERRSALDKDLFRVRAQMEKISDRLSARVNYILSEYNLTEEGAKQYRSEEKLSAAQMKKEIDARKSAIRALGSVNVNAIEDYRQVSARYTQVKTQHDDLKKAEESLVQIIVQLDEGMRRQFNEQFAKIRTEFNKVFRELFGGGRGELRLEEGVDVLEAGITIIAEPPGKKLQNMMQLSGGEKALTAISLLFAIQNLKPSPFALLDEIEAALDDSNVERFTEYLKKLTKNTQFIVITHRRGTMVGADRLYGITMQEKGISTLVSVKLIEDSLDK